MKVSGFTIIRNAIKYDFPVVESIMSALPIVEEYVVNVGRSEDDTLELIRSIGSPKIKIVETVWDDSLRSNGQVIGMQQDMALRHCSGDWALLLQADEVLHEADYSVIVEAMSQYLGQSSVLGLVFRMLHFKGDYWSIDPWMYHKATRIVRNTGAVRSATDGCDFVVEGSDRMIKASAGSRLIGARIFHYGWVKDSNILREKLQYQISRHEGDLLGDEEIRLRAEQSAGFPKYEILKEYGGSHPRTMQKRMRAARRLRPRRNRWLTPRFYREVLHHGFKG